MKEVDIFPDDPKSAESIKQLEQVVYYNFNDFTQGSFFFSSFK